jgi:hypothetical protein
VSTPAIASVPALEARVVYLGARNTELENLGEVELSDPHTMVAVGFS